MRRARINILFGGLAGFISVAFLQLLSVDITKSSLSLTIAIFLFTISLPLSIFYVLSANEHLNVEKTEVPFWYVFFAVFTIIAGFAGITLLFYYFNQIYAYSFVIVSIIALGVFNKLDEKKNKYFQKIRNTYKKTKAKVKKSTKKE